MLGAVHGGNPGVSDVVVSPGVRDVDIVWVSVVGMEDKSPAAVAALTCRGLVATFTCRGFVVWFTCKGLVACKGLAVWLTCRGLAG